MQIGEKIYEKNRDAPARVIEGKTLIVMPASGVSYVLNETATCIWELIDGEHSVKEIIAAICNEFDVKRAEAERDAIELLRKLEKEKIIIPQR